MEFGNDFELLRYPIYCESKLKITNASRTSSYFHESIIALTHRQSLKSGATAFDLSFVGDSVVLAPI